MRKEIKFFKHLISSIGLIVISLFLLVDLTYSKDLYQMTVGEITKNSKESNPMNYIADYINDNGYIDGSAWEVIDAYLDEYETLLEEKIYINGKIIKEEISKNNFNQALSLKNILTLCLMLIFVVLSILLIIKNKKNYAILTSIVAVVLVILKLVSFFNITNKDYITDYLNNGVLSENISSRIDLDFGDDFINEMCDRKYGIGMCINDFIVKSYYAVQCKANNEKVYKDNLDHKYLWGADVDTLYYSYKDKLSQLDNTAYKYDEEGSYGASVSYKKIKELYNKMSNEDVIDFNNGVYLDKLINKLEKVLKHSDKKELEESTENIIDYMGRLGAMYFWNGYVETEVIRYFKDWYIDGEDRVVELPYDYYLTYKKEQFIKKDIKEFIKSNINNIDVETAGGESLIIYYRDSEDNIKGDFVILQTVEENGKDKLYFNKTQFLYDIREPIYYISLNEKVEFIDEKSQLFYNELDKYAIFDEDEGIDIDEAKEKEYYSDGVTEKMYNEDGVLLEDWTDKSEEIKEVVDNDELVEKSFGTKRDWQIVRLVSSKYYDYNQRDVKRYRFTQRFINKFIDFRMVTNYIDSKKEEDLPLDISIVKTDKVIKKLILRDTNEEKYCIFNVHWTDDGMIDDIEYYIVPEDKMHLSYEEMYQLAFND